MLADGFQTSTDTSTSARPKQIDDVPVQWSASCTSTQTLAVDLARAGAPETVIATDEQTAGRGRLGRIWTSGPRESLLFSWLTRPALRMNDAPRAVLQWAAALAELLDLRVKWPNDLVDHADRKVAGLLAQVEASPGGENVAWLVLGVGLNLHQTEFPEGLHASSLRMLGRGNLSADGLLVDVLRTLRATPLHTPDPLGVWRRRSATLGRRVRIGDRTGLATGVRDDGALLVDGAPVLAGDVDLVAGNG